MIIFKDAPIFVSACLLNIIKVLLFLLYIGWKNNNNRNNSSWYKISFENCMGILKVGYLFDTVIASLDDKNYRFSILNETVLVADQDEKKYMYIRMLTLKVF